MSSSAAKSPIALDTETALIRPALLAPPLVCVTWARPGLEPRIVHQSDAEHRLRELLAGDDLIVGQNVAYDMAVVCERFPRLRPLVFAAYDADRVTDTKIRQQLLDIAGGVYRGRVGDKGRWIKHEYSLEALARRLTGVHLAKDGWRLSYAEFLDTPLAEWPARAREVQAAARARLVAGNLSGEETKQLTALVESDPERPVRYAIEDACATLAVYSKQEVHADYLHDQFRQARAAFWLHLSSAWGLRTDAIGVETLRRETQAAHDELEEELRLAGLVRADGTRDTKAAKALMIAVCEREGLRLRRTDAHASCSAGDACTDHVCLDADACAATGDETLAAYAEISTLKKVLSNDVEALRKGTAYPVHTRYGLAETGRTTSSGPNIQNLRRRAGIREAFVPRLGKVFAQADYPQLELYTLAQCCVSWVGKSKLADALNAGLDPHLAMAAQILGITYDDAKANIERDDVDNARQTAKVANFGFPGGLGIEKLILFAKKAYRVELRHEQAKCLKEQWFATWPEMPHYFARINALCDTEDGLAVVETLFTNRFRGGATYCAACNNGFQALGADCAKSAGWLIAKAHYLNKASPLFNARTVAFVHDEFIVEVDAGPSAEAAARELARLMVVGANVYLPDVPIPLSKMKPLLMRRWSKKAKQVFDAAGGLIPWE